MNLFNKILKITVLLFITALPVVLNAQSNVVVVDQMMNFPDPVENEIKLEADKVYKIQGIIDIGDNYINTNGASLIGNAGGKDGILSRVKGAVLRSQDVM